MKVRIGETDNEVEVGQVKTIDKGCLKAAFSMMLYPSGQKISECKYFIQGDNRWFSFPQKEIKYTDGRKTEYFPLVSYLNKEYSEQLKEAVLECLKHAIPTGHNADQKTSCQAQASRAPRVQAEPSLDWGSTPF